MAIVQQLRFGRVRNTANRLMAQDSLMNAVHQVHVGKARR